MRVVMRPWLGVVLLVCGCAGRQAAPPATRDAQLAQCLAAALEAELPESPGHVSGMLDADGSLQFLAQRMQSPYARTLGRCVAGHVSSWGVPRREDWRDLALVMHLRPEGTPAPALGGCRPLAEARVDGQHLTVVAGPKDWRGSSPFLPDDVAAMLEKGPRVIFSVAAGLMADGKLYDVQWDGEARHLDLVRRSFRYAALQPYEACGVPVDSQVVLSFGYGGR